MSLQKRKRIQTFNTEPTMTQQQFKSQCDINQIIKKFEKTGMISHLNNNAGNYGDFSTIQNFQQNLNMVLSAQSSFDALPPEVRKRFGNNPSNLIDFVQNESNYEEAVKLGLVQKKPDPAPTQNDDKTTITQGATIQAPFTIQKAYLNSLRPL